MKPDDKHKKKATRQWQAKNGIVAPKLSKQQKDKERVKQLQSNWDRYDMTGETVTTKGALVGDVLAMATPPSAFHNQTSSNFVPHFNYPIKLSDYESSLQNLDYAKLLKVKNPEQELAIILNHQAVETEEEDLLYDPIYEALLQQNPPQIQSDDENLQQNSEIVECVDKLNISSESKAEKIEEDLQTKEKTSASEGSELDEMEDWLDSVI